MGKDIIYNWCPDGNCKRPDFSVELTSPISDASNMNTGNVQFYATVTAGGSPISK